MTKYCTLCQRKVDPVKKPWSWGFFLLWCLGFGVGGIVYLVYHFLLKGTKFCPICWTKKLVKHSPDEIEMMEAQRAEKKEARKEKIDGAVNYVKEQMNGE